MVCITRLTPPSGHSVCHLKLKNSFILKKKTQPTNTPLKPLLLEPTWMLQSYVEASEELLSTRLDVK